MAGIQRPARFTKHYCYGATLFYVDVALEIQWRRGFAVGDRKGLPWRAA